MKFKRRMHNSFTLAQPEITPLINCIFLLLIFFMLASSFTAISGINVKLPKIITSQYLSPQTLFIAISSADTIYMQDKAITLKDVEILLKKGRYNAVFIKSDKNVSLGVLTGIWSICKKLGIEKIGIANTYEE